MAFHLFQAHPHLNGKNIQLPRKIFIFHWISKNSAAPEIFIFIWISFLFAENLLKIDNSWKLWELEILEQNEIIGSFFSVLYSGIIFYSTSAPESARRVSRSECTNTKLGRQISLDACKSSIFGMNLNDSSARNLSSTSAFTLFNYASHLESRHKPSPKLTAKARTMEIGDVFGLVSRCVI